MYICILKGENDDNLVWPFQTNIVVELFNCIRLKNTYFSPPFNTSLQGYKMCLKVNAAGNVGTHVAIHFFNER